MMATGLRLMYWPNEPARLHPGFTQAGGRAALQALVEDGTLAALEIYSYQVERAAFASLTAFEAAALAAIRAFAPDILFVQHVFGTEVPETFWSRVRQKLPQVTLVYHEGDPFDRRVKRIDAPTVAVLRHADLVLACGLGSLAEILGEHTKSPVGYLPHCFVKSRFAVLDPALAEKKHDIVMIGNRGSRRRLKWLYLPGGKRFALYGLGWSDLEASRGSLPFFEQEQAIQSGRITANWDHFDTIDCYYSDRLPISLAAGVPHVTTHHVGYDHVFARCPGLYSCKTVTEAVETCRWLLSRSDADLLEEGLAAKAWGFANMEADIVFRRGFEQAAAARRVRLS